MTIPTIFRVVSTAVPTPFQGGVRSNPYNPKGVGTPRWKTGLNASSVWKRCTRRSPPRPRLRTGRTPGESGDDGARPSRAARGSRRICAWRGKPAGSWIGSRCDVGPCRTKGKTPGGPGGSGRPNPWQRLGKYHRAGSSMLPFLALPECPAKSATASAQAPSGLDRPAAGRDSSHHKQHRHRSDARVSQREEDHVQAPSIR